MLKDSPSSPPPAGCVEHVLVSAHCGRQCEAGGALARFVFIAFAPVLAPYVQGLEIVVLKKI